MAVMPSTGAKETDICVVINSWHKQITGKGCGHARSKVLGNMLVIEMSGFLTKHEETLTTTTEGAETVRRLREVVIRNNREDLEEAVSKHMERTCHFLVYKLDQDFGKATLVMILD
ncbi:MAG: Na-translocating system protein MpsC family protein [Methylocystaceae bacterium]